MKTKKIISIMSLCMIAVLVVVACAACTSWESFKNDVKDAFVAFDGNGNGMKAGQTYDMPEEMTFTGLKMSGNQNQGITLTATLSPASAICLVDWSVAWKNPSDSWINGKPVTDYVTVSPTSDGALTATVAMQALFSSEVQVRCAARLDSSVYATCDVGCYGRLTNHCSVSLYSVKDEQTYSFGDGYVSSAAQHGTVQTLQPFFTFHQGQFAYPDSDTTCLYKQGVGRLSYIEDTNYGNHTSVSTSTVVSLSVKPSAELYASFQSNNMIYTQYDGDWIVVPQNNGDYLVGDVYSYLYGAGNYLYPHMYSAGSTDTTANSYIDTFNYCVSQCVGSYDFIVRVNVTNAVSDVIYEVYCKFDRTASVFSVSSVSLSNASITL